MDYDGPTQRLFALAVSHIESKSLRHTEVQCERRVSDGSLNVLNYHRIGWHQSPRRHATHCEQSKSKELSRVDDMKNRFSGGKNSRNYYLWPNDKGLDGCSRLREYVRLRPHCAVTIIINCCQHSIRTRSSVFMLVQSGDTRRLGTKN